VIRSLEDNLAKSVVIDKSKESILAHFALSEIHKGKKLGSGQFGNVFQVDGVDISDEAEIDTEQMDEREFIAKFCHRDASEEARYAIKILKAEVVEDPQMFVRGLIDLAMEANFLSNLEHPNIIKVRGAGVDAILGTKDYFVVMDRLSDTLDRRMDHWKKTNKKLSGPAGLMKSAQKHDLLVERLHVAYELSAALSYLHQNK
jgi:serine/threonine protein kinase